MSPLRAASLFVMAAAPALLLGAWAGSGFPISSPPEPAPANAASADGMDCAERDEVRALRAEVDALEAQLAREAP